MFPGKIRSFPLHTLVGQPELFAPLLRFTTPETHESTLSPQSSETARTGLIWVDCNLKVDICNLELDT